MADMVYKMALLPIIVFNLLCATGSGVSPAEALLYSPDSSLLFRLYIDQDSDARYEVHYKGIAVIEQASLGLELDKEGDCGNYVRIHSVNRNSEDQYWETLYGERTSIRNHYKAMSVLLQDADKDIPGMTLKVRAYNEGVAFRYEIERDSAFEILKENTRFAFNKAVKAWVSYKAQGSIFKTSLDSIRESCERPMLLEYDAGTFLAIGEAGLFDFARMKFMRDSLRDHSLLSQLSGKVSCEGKIASPWRYIMFADSPASLLQNNSLLLNLNEPNRIKDSDWIKPGKVIREVTLTTKGGRACVDFASRYNFLYIEFDAGWYGNENEITSDATFVSVDPKRSPGPLDLFEVIKYAESKGIGVILYVNRIALEQQLDTLLPLYNSWGVAGVKFGFVHVGSQEWTRWLHESVIKAAEHQLMVNVHDEYRPTGISRTYPNLITQEGIRGDEESPSNSMVLYTLFTRMIAGAGDHANCYFAERVGAKMGSHASQMAKSICIYSPWQFLFWYDRPYGSPGRKGGAGGVKGTIPDIEDLQFYARLPTVWDETRILQGYPGEYALVARRKGMTWFVGGLNGAGDRDFKLTFDFLQEGQIYEATIYTDDKNLGTRTNVKIETRDITSESIFNLTIHAQNGIAAILKPSVR